MGRNYKKESEWQKKKYDLIKANIDKDLGSKLRLKLKREKKTIAYWITRNAEDYVKGEEYEEEAD